MRLDASTGIVSFRLSGTTPFSFQPAFGCCSRLQRIYTRWHMTFSAGTTQVPLKPPIQCRYYRVHTHPLMEKKSKGRDSHLQACESRPSEPQPLTHIRATKVMYTVKWALYSFDVQRDFCDPARPANPPLVPRDLSYALGEGTRTATLRTLSPSDPPTRSRLRLIPSSL